MDHGFSVRDYLVLFGLPHENCQKIRKASSEPKLEKQSLAKLKRSTGKRSLAKPKKKKHSKGYRRNMFKCPLPTIDMFGWTSRDKIRKAWSKSLAAWERFQSLCTLTEGKEVNKEVKAPFDKYKVIIRRQIRLCRKLKQKHLRKTLKIFFRHKFKALSCAQKE